MRKLHFAALAIVMSLTLGIPTRSAINQMLATKQVEAPTQAMAAQIEQTANRGGSTTQTSAALTPMLNDHKITGGPIPDGCGTPQPKSMFDPTDMRVYQWILISGVNLNDTVRWEFIQPDGFTFSAPRLTLTIAGTVCLWAWMDIAGQPPASIPGNWVARFFHNNVFVVEGTFTIARQGGSGQGKVCRTEMSLFYAGMQSLGGAWGRPACPFEPDPLVPMTVSAMQGAINNAITAVRAIPCIRFDVTRLASLSARLPGMRKQQAIQETEQLIQELQLATRLASIRCDNGINLESLLVAGIHLGAAQAWASCFQCQPPPPIPANIQAVINNHLNTARTGLMGFSACLPPGFTFNIFNNVPVGSMNSIEPHTFIVGIHTLVLWNVALSDCCCMCT
jgi:hypothetical protein